MGILQLAEIPLNMEGSYLIDKLIPRHDLVVIWGKPKTGKTFWVVDLCMHIAAGLPYRGRSTKKGVVVYCTLEGAWEFGARAKAAANTLGLDPTSVDFYCSPDRRIFTKVGGAEGLIKEINDAGLSPALVVLDTLSRSIDGSENNDQDMTFYTRCAEDICDRFNCAVIIVHHGRKDGDTPRGHTSLTGTCAAQLKVTKVSAANGSNPAMMSVLVEFVKDGPEGDVLFNWVRPCVIAHNNEGRPIETCFLEGAPAPSGKIAGGILNPQASKALSILQQLVSESKDGRVDLKQWRVTCEALPISRSESGSRQAFWRAHALLRDKGFIEIVDTTWVKLRTPE